MAASFYRKKRYLSTKTFMGQYINQRCTAKGKSMSKAKKQHDPNRLYDKDAEPQLSETDQLREAGEWWTESSLGSEFISESHHSLILYEIAKAI